MKTKNDKCLHLLNIFFSDVRAADSENIFLLQASVIIN